MWVYAKLGFEKKTSKDIKSNNKFFFKHIRSRKLAREVWEPIDKQGIKAFAMYKLGEVSMLKLFFLEEVLENLSQTEVLVEQIIEQIDRILKPPELNGTCPSSNGMQTWNGWTT